MRREAILRVPMPRLLPTTIFGLAILLAVKMVDLGRLIMPAVAAEQAAGASPVHEAGVPPPPVQRSTPRTAQEPPATLAAIAPEPAAAKPEPPPVSDSERALLLELRQRRQELDGRDAALATREAVLAAAEHKLAARVDELQSLQARLEGLETARKSRDEANWRGLVKLYESMRPREAAAIFNELETSVLLQVLDRMKEAKAAVILAAMLPDKARQVTADLAQMRTRQNAETGASSGS